MWNPLSGHALSAEELWMCSLQCEQQVELNTFRKHTFQHRSLSNICFRFASNSLSGMHLQAKSDVVFMEAGFSFYNFLSRPEMSLTVIRWWMCNAAYSVTATDFRQLVLPRMPFCLIGIISQWMPGHPGWWGHWFAELLFCLDDELSLMSPYGWNCCIFTLQQIKLKSVRGNGQCALG